MRLPVGTFKHALVTVEWSPVEPQLENEVYVAGLGEVTEEVIQGGHEGFRLVKVTHRHALSARSIARLKNDLGCSYAATALPGGRTASLA